MLKKISTLVRAAGLAQVIGFITFPIIARLVTPEEFGLFYFYASVAGLLGGLITWKLEQLFFSETSEEVVERLRRLAYKSVLYGSAISVVALIGYLAMSGVPNFAWCLIPIGIFSAAAVIPNYFYLLRFEDMSSISQFRILLAVGQAVAQILFCLYSPTYISLLTGLFMAQIFCAGFLYFRMNRVRTRKGLTGNFLDHPSINYQLLFFGTVASLLNTLNTNFIPSFFTFFKYLDLGGYVAGIHRIFMMPVNLIASSVSHIMLSEYTKSPKTIVKILWILFGIVFLFDTTIFLMLEQVGQILVWILGEKWTNVAQIFRYFFVIYSFVFLGVIINQACIAAKLQKLCLFTETLKLIAIVSSFEIVLAIESINILPLYSVIVSGMMVSVLIILLLALSNHSRDFNFTQGPSD